MNNRKKIYGIALMLSLFVAIDALAQDGGVLKNKGNYKTHPAGKNSTVKSETAGVLTETVEAKSYKAQHTKSSTKKVKLNAGNDKRKNYKMNRSNA